MKTQLRNWSLFAILTGSTVLLLTTFPVIGEIENNVAIKNTPDTAQTQVPSWSERRPDYTKPSKTELKKRLTKIQYDVTQKDGTERPFKNEYWDNNRDGIYVDIVSGEPLFSSKDKFKSGTGWPSFTRPLVDNALLEKADFSIFGIRTELRSVHADSHLGHVFEDGPEPTGLRYCINSAALKFIEKEKLVTEGYAEFYSLFDE